MRILIIHQGFPGQYVHIIKHLVSRGDDVSTITIRGDLTKMPKGVKVHQYGLTRGNGIGTHKLAIETESKIIRGEAVAVKAQSLMKAGYVPDIILAHPGWGEALFLKDIWPRTPQLHYVEYAYGSNGTDSQFKDTYALVDTWEERARTRMKNANVLLNLDVMDWGVAPTAFQKSTVPFWGQLKTSVIHDGIDTMWASPNSNARYKLPNGTTLTNRDEIITFINRTFEPYRGIHIFLEAIATVLETCPNSQVILVGEDTPKVSYGAHRTDGKGWLTQLKGEIGKNIDWGRVHCVGRVPHKQLREIYRISSAHIYFTYPFVLSWSLLEAMSCGALVIGSATAPVQEVINPNNNGLLVGFSDSKGLARAIIDALKNPNDYASLRREARKTIINRYELDICLNKHVALIDWVSKNVLTA